VYNESWPSINQCSILIIMWRNYKKKEKKKPLFEVEGVKVKKKPDLVDKLDRIFSLFIRYRDTMPNGYFQCISCGKIKPFNKADCGHYINRQHMSTRFDEMNCNAQCSHCNRFMEGNIQDYRRRLVAKGFSGTGGKNYHVVFLFLGFKNADCCITSTFLVVS